MAIGMMKLRNGSKGKGVAHFNYIMREDKYKPHADKFEKFENSGHGNMPQWAKDNPKLFWQEADKHERENGRVYKEHIIALPRELNETQRLELVNDWIKNEVGDKHPYSFAIHTPQGMDGKEQPHVHFMFSQRTHDNIERSPDQFFKRYNSKDPSKGGAKKANETLTKTQSKEKTKEQRLRLGDFINKHLERAGSRNRVDMRNWKEKGLDQKPLNITYKEMKDPLVEKAYKAKIEAQAEIKEAIKERIEMIEFGKSKAIIKDLEIRIAQEQASKAYTMTKPAEPPQEQPAEQKSRKGQWVRHRQKDKEQGEAVTTPPPPPTEQKEQKQGFDFKAIRRSQLEKRQAELKQQIDQTKQLKGLATNHDTIKQQPPEIQQEIKQEALKRLSEIDHRATNKCLMSDDIEAYQKAKGILNSVERLEEQRQAQEQNKKQSELTAVSEPKPSHAQNATQKPIEQRKTEKARVVPPAPEKSHHSENRQQNEPSQPSIDIKKAEQTFSDYLKKVEEVAKTILNNQLKALREKAKPLLEKFENLRDNKPKSEYVRPEFMGKSKWAIEKDEAQTAYSNIKTTHDNLKEKGVTDDHRTQAKQQIAKDDPTLHSEALKAQKDIEAHRAEQKKAQEATAQYIDPDFAKIKAMDKEQRQRMKENFEKGLNVSPATLKNFSKEQLDTLKSMQTEGRKFLQALQSVETHERLSEQLERMQQDREQGRSNNIDRQFD